RIVYEEERLVPDDWPAQVVVETIVGETGVVGGLSGAELPGHGRVDGVEIPIFQVLIGLSMEGVCSALDHLIELAAVGVTELGAEDVLKNCELLHRVVRYYQRRTATAFLILVDALP